MLYYLKSIHSIRLNLLVSVIAQYKNLPDLHILNQFLKTRQISLSSILTSQRRSQLYRIISLAIKLSEIYILSILPFPNKRNLFQGSQGRVVICRLSFNYQLTSLGMSLQNMFQFKPQIVQAIFGRLLFSSAENENLYALSFGKKASYSWSILRIIFLKWGFLE